LHAPVTRVTANTINAARRPLANKAHTAKITPPGKNIRSAPSAPTANITRLTGPLFTGLNAAAHSASQRFTAAKADDRIASMAIATRRYVRRAA
jgi:hypothetical protein